MTDQARRPVKNEALYHRILQFIDENYVASAPQIRYSVVSPTEEASWQESLLEIRISPEHLESRRKLAAKRAKAGSFSGILSTFKARHRAPGPEAAKQLDRLQNLFEEQGHVETFSEHMLRIIRERGLVETDVYRSVFMDRKLFNKIRNFPDYRPSKKTGGVEICTAQGEKRWVSYDSILKSGYTAEELL